MSSTRKLAIADPNATKARLEPGRKWIAIKHLEAPRELQPRDGIHLPWCSELEGFRRDGSEFPPARVYQLADGRLMLAEGHHRRQALLNMQEPDMLCEVVDGTMEDAIEYAAGSNKSNGVKPMGPKDVTRALEMLFTIPRYWQATNKRLADKVGCSAAKARERRALWAASHGIPVPVIREDARGRIQTASNRKSWSRDLLISSNPGNYKSSENVRCIYRGKTYYGANESDLKKSMEKIFGDEDKKTRLLSSNALRSRFRSFGFESLKFSPTSGISGLYGNGIVACGCIFSEYTSVVETIGNLKALCIAVGRLEAGRQTYRHSTRQIVICYQEYGPKEAIKLFEEAGIEFMTPDELIRSLGAGGMTPDEIQASLKGAAE